MPARKGLLAPQNTFLDTIATRFDGTHSNFVLGNAKIAINPIVYCSDGFCDLTGYSRAHIMQKSCACNFLYGPRTDFRHKEAISRALEQKQELKLEVILYKRTSGQAGNLAGANQQQDARTPFWCLLDIVPIQDEKHEVVLFLCSHKDITKQKWHEEKEHELARLKQLKQLASVNQHQDQHQEDATGQQHRLPQPAPDRSASDAKSNQETSPEAEQVNQHQLQQQQNSDNQQDADNKRLTSNVDDADDEELTALANQNALISMDEFRLENCVGDDDNDFDDDDDDEDHDKHTANQYSRRRSRAVLYQLSGHYGNRRSVNMKSKLKLNNRMNIPEYKTTTIEKQKFILSHYGIGKTCWDWLILVVSFYVAIVVPYNATFNDKQQDLISGAGKIDSIDIIVEVVFIIDVILNFRTTFVNRKGEVVTRPKIICRHYLRGWFMVDACAAVPFDLLCGLNIYDRSILKVDLNLLKLIRLLRLARLLQKMDRYSQYSYIILTLLILIFSLLAHWCACIWYVIAMKEIDAHPDWKIGWIHQLSDKLGYSVINATDLASSYVTALYFTTSSLTSVGFGNVSANTNAEKIFSIVIMLIGALMHAVVFGNVTALIRVMYARRSNYQTRLRDLKDFFRLHQLPKELQQRMSDYFQTTWSLNHGIETSEILRDFPEELRGDVSLHLHHEVLSLPIFETAPQGFLKQLARHIESKFCCPTEYLIHRRDALNYLYLVCNGSMEVLQDNMVVAILGKGDLVGYDVSAHIAAQQLDQSDRTRQSGVGACKGQTTSMGSAAMGGLVKSSSDLKALTYCDLKCIHISGLLEVLKLYPEFSDTFHREIMHDLSFNLRESREDHGIDDTTDEEEDDDDDDDDEAENEDEEDQDDDEDGDEDEDRSNHRAPRQRAALISPPESLIENNDDDADDGSAGRRGRQARARPAQTTRRSPPPSIGHLYRSITGSGGENHNQIGRYDHEEIDGETERGEPAAGGTSILPSGLVEEDELDEEEEEEEEQDQADEEEEEAEASIDHEAGDQNDRGDNDRGGAGGGSATGASQRNAANGHCGQRRADGRSVNESNGSSEQNGRAASGWSAANGAQQQQQPVLGRGLTGARETLVRRRRSSCSDLDEDDANKADADWQSAHSDEGRLQISEEDKKPLLSNDSILNPCGFAGKPLRSAILGRPGQAAAGMRVAKPPISFDLSRNTTAIVDRRRRSAGCIPRALLQGAASSVVARANHSSLIHINEEPHDAPVPREPVAAAAQQKSRARQVQQKSNRAAPAPTDRHLSELKRIDSRINGLEESVSEMRKELKRELKSEMHSIKSAIELQLKQLVASKDQARPNKHQRQQQQRQNSFQSTACHSRKSRRSSGGPAISQSSSDVRNSSALCLPSSAIVVQGQTNSQRVRGKSASFNILPTSPAYGDGNLATDRLAATHGPSMLKKSQSAASFKRQAPVAATRLSITSDQHAMLVGLANRYLKNLEEVTPTHACASSMLVSLPTSGREFATATVIPAAAATPFQSSNQQRENQIPIRQSSSGVNFNNASDNDSGRSSSSVNSSMNIAGLQQQAAKATVVSQKADGPWPMQNHAVVQVAASPAPSDAHLVNQFRGAGGRAAKMLLSSATTLALNDGELNNERYIIDLDPEAATR